MFNDPIDLFGVTPSIPGNDHVSFGSFSWYIRTTLGDERFAGEPWNRGVYAGIVAWGEETGLIAERRTNAIAFGVEQALELFPPEHRGHLRKVAFDAFGAALNEVRRQHRGQKAPGKPGAWKRFKDSLKI